MRQEQDTRDLIEEVVIKKLYPIYRNGREGGGRERQEVQALGGDVESILSLCGFLWDLVAVHQSCNDIEETRDFLETMKS